MPKQSPSDDNVGRMQFLLGLRRRGISDPAVLRAMDEVPREHFVENSLLDKAYAERDGTLVWLKVHPRLDPIRGEPRFRDLLVRGRAVLSRRRGHDPLTEEDFRYLHETHGLPREFVVEILLDHPLPRQTGRRGR